MPFKQVNSLLRMFFFFFFKLPFISPNFVNLQMEAISGFLNVANQYLPSREVFMTIDLFEGQNMAQVILCLFPFPLLSFSWASNHQNPGYSLPC